MSIFKEEDSLPVSHNFATLQASSNYRTPARDKKSTTAKRNHLNTAGAQPHHYMNHGAQSMLEFSDE